MTSKRDTYGPGGSYHCFTGKDASRALGKSSLKEEDLVADYSTLDQQQLKVLEDWYTFFSYVKSPSLRHKDLPDFRRRRKRYNIVGQVTDLPSAVSNL